MNLYEAASLKLLIENLFNRKPNEVVIEFHEGSVSDQ